MEILILIIFANFYPNFDRCFFYIVLHRQKPRWFKYSIQQIKIILMLNLFSTVQTCQDINNKLIQVTYYYLFWWSSTKAHLKQIAEMNTPHSNWGEMVCFKKNNNIHITTKQYQVSSVCGKWRNHYEKQSVVLLFWWTSTKAHLNKWQKWIHHIQIKGKQSVSCLL